MNLAAAAKLYDLPFEGAWVTSVCFLGGTRRVVAGNRNGEMFLWALPEKADETPPQPVRKLAGHSNEVTRLIATADGKTLFSASFDRSIGIWDPAAPASGTEQVTIDAEAQAARAKEKKQPAPKELAKVEVEVLQPVHKLEGHADWIKAMVLSRDEKLLVSGDDGGIVIVWDVAARKELGRFQVGGWVAALALSPDNQRLFISESVPRDFDERYNAQKIRETLTGNVVLDLEADKASPLKKFVTGAAAWSPDGKLLALGREGEADGTILLVDPDSGKLVREIKPAHQYGVTALGFSEDGAHLISTGRDTTLKVWTAADGKKVAELGKPRGGQFKDWLHAFDLSREQNLLAAADMAGLVTVWSLAAR
ncbi:MAG: hypothetical protein WD069_18020 [Planctomycetales bacterium]